MDRYIIGDPLFWTTQKYLTGSYEQCMKQNDSTEQKPKTKPKKITVTYSCPGFRFPPRDVPLDDPEFRGCWEAYLKSETKHFEANKKEFSAIWNRREWYGPAVQDQFEPWLEFQSSDLEKAEFCTYRMCF